MPYKDLEARRVCKRKHYEGHKKSVGDKVKAYKARMRQEWHEFKSSLACNACGENDPITLDFHHIERHPSNRKLHVLLRNGAYVQVYEEVKKCMVLCSNCHRKHHQKERDEKKEAEAS